MPVLASQRALSLMAHVVGRTVDSLQWVMSPLSASEFAGSKCNSIAYASSICAGEFGAANGFGFTNPRYRRDNSLEKARLR
ncbi:MAG: hypothetical protein EAZ24_01030 [Burkholderiales bacterium]|nr:MAG: hypothetical protein EAZ21_04350 [Betaproteobacteria bacterium]TAG84565.1 MAG: hypothetical protein EAZ24_01030 [Burkholderiales bacterium]